MLPFDELMLNSVSRDFSSSQDHNCSVMLASIATRCDGLSGRILRESVLAAHAYALFLWASTLG